MTWREQYQQAHRQFQEVSYPTATKDFGHISTTFPDVTKANGLTRAITNYLSWTGSYANRISSAGRMGKAQERQASGNILTINKFIPSATKRGTADIHCVINGKHVSIEIKIGRDRMSEHQITEQQRITAAGGIYIVIHTIEEFFTWYNMNVEIWK